MPEILEILRGKFGETMDAAEKMQLQTAFGEERGSGRETGGLRPAI